MPIEYRVMCRCAFALDIGKQSCRGLRHSVYSTLTLSLSRPSSLYRALVRHIAVCTLWIIILSFRPTYIQYIIYSSTGLAPHAKKKQKKQRRASHRDMPSSRYKLGELRQIDTHTRSPQVCVCINNMQIHIVNTYLHKVK